VKYLSDAIKEIPQAIILSINMGYENGSDDNGSTISNEGAVNLSQALSTLKNLTDLTLNLRDNHIAKTGVLSIA
jgi:hypothetical protein